MSACKLITRLISLPQPSIFSVETGSVPVTYIHLLTFSIDTLEVILNYMLPDPADVVLTQS